MEIFKDIICNQNSEGNYSAEAGIELSHIILKAHFPENPILPGVVILQLINRIVSKSTGSVLKLSEVGSVKFVRPIIPVKDKLLRVDFDCIPQTNGFMVSAQLYYENEITAHFKNLVYTA